MTNEVQASKEDDGDVFLGEANAMRYVHDGSESVQPVPSLANKARFKYSVPHGLKADALMPPWEAERRQKRINDLSAFFHSHVMGMYDN